MTKPTPPILPQSWKKRYPFRLATTSFIFPADYDENVDRLGPFVDEIELLMFESRPGSRPTRELVQSLASLAKAHRVTYNVHLPVDLDPAHPEDSLRKQACRTLQAFIDTLMPLEPSVFVLHLAPPEGLGQGKALARWQRRASASLDEILRVGLQPRRLALENLFFPFSWLAPVLAERDLSVCLDTGHLALQGGAVEGFLTDFGDRIAIAHLHGLQEGRDHAPLTALPKAYHGPLVAWLGRFQGTVSLEVFGFDALRASLFYLERMMRLFPGQSCREPPGQGLH